jgi:plasmid stabilization system protein ParE
MVNPHFEVVWTKQAEKQLFQAYTHISKDSTQNAQKVLEDLTTTVYKAVGNPEFHGPDKYKIDNDGSYRAFEKHRYRISYRFSKNIIRVLRVRHTTMDPKHY